jgi:hypothetical protein
MVGRHTWGTGSARGPIDRPLVGKEHTTIYILTPLQFCLLWLSKYRGEFHNTALISILGIMAGPMTLSLADEDAQL